VTRNDLLQSKPDVMRRFVEASMEGWKSYLKNPAAGNAIIKKENPNMDDPLLAFAVGQMKKLGLIDGGDAKTMGIGVMTDARWKKTRDFMVQAKLLDAKVDWKAAYTTQFVKPTAKKN
jgi:NitT/TauT family transport system substrate-binding protein